jgi:signal transduction histidine kinase
LSILDFGFWILDWSDKGNGSGPSGASAVAGNPKSKIQNPISKHMGADLRTTVNAFIEDTCVLVAVAYLLARGRVLSLLFRQRLPLWKTAYLGAVLGLVGLTEVAFPGARLPYATHTLIVTFAVLAGGLGVGLISAAVVTLGAFILRPPQSTAGMMVETFGSALAAEAVHRSAVGMMVGMFASALAAEAVHRIFRARRRLLAGFVAGLLTQSCTVLVQFLLAAPLPAPNLVFARLQTILANGFGVMLLMLVVNDAQLRADSERHRAEAERAHALVAEAQLNALRARVHPHFLFNTLTSIAALCLDAPARAEAAIVRLGQIMRRVLEADPTVPLCLGEEIEHVRSYLEIEQLRLGGRLSVSWCIAAGCEQLRVPPFAVQTLVENAIQHGIAPKMEPGEITITVRRYPCHTLVAVRDDGIGMPVGYRQQALAPPAERLHGLQILTQQLTLLYDQRARLRLFSRSEQGTLAVFVIPNREKLIVHPGVETE